MSNVLAGIGRGQLEVLLQRVNRRRGINVFYRELLGSVEGISFLTEPNGDFYSNYWLTTIIIDPKVNGFNRFDLYTALEKDNIESRPLWKPMHLQPVFQQYASYLNGQSEDLFNHGLCLPSGSNMEEDDMYRIKKALRKIIQL